MSRPLVTTSVSIIWHHIVINKTWGGFNGKRETKSSTLGKKNCFANFFPRKMEKNSFLLMLFRSQSTCKGRWFRDETRLNLTLSNPCCTNFPINNSMLMDPNNATAQREALSYYTVDEYTLKVLSQVRFWKGFLCIIYSFIKNVLNESRRCSNISSRSTMREVQRGKSRFRKMT